MVLNMTDFGKFWNSLQTPWNASYVLENEILTRCWTICVEFERIHEGRKLTAVDQKPWAIAHGFEHDGFWQVLEFAPNSVKRLLSAWKWISNRLQDYLSRIRTNSRGSEIDRFWPKTLGYSPWFWTWRILASSGIRSKLRETPPKCLKMDF